MAARLKTPAQAVPQNLKEAEALAAQIGENLRAIAAKDAAVTEAVVKLKLLAREQTADLAASVKAQFVALTAFAQAHRTEILPADRKSLTIAAGVIGWRKSNPTVEIQDGMEEEVIAYLREEGGQHFLVEKTEISKAALLADRAYADGVPHVAITQVEQFFFKPLDVDLEQSRNLGKVPADREAA